MNILCRTCRFNKAEEEKKEDRRDRTTSLAGLATMILNSGPLSCIWFSFFFLCESKFCKSFRVHFDYRLCIVTSHKQTIMLAQHHKNDTVYTSHREWNQWTWATTAIATTTMPANQTTSQPSSHWNNLHKIWLLYILIAKFIVCDRRREIAVPGTCTRTVYTRNRMQWNCARVSHVISQTYT